MVHANMCLQMEADMVAISRGTKTKQEVLEANIRMYKAIFVKVSEDYVAKMDEVCVYVFFSRLNFIALCRRVQSILNHLVPIFNSHTNKRTSPNAANVEG